LLRSRYLGCPALLPSSEPYAIGARLTSFTDDIEPRHFKRHEQEGIGIVRAIASSEFAFVYHDCVRRRDHEGSFGINSGAARDLFCQPRSLQAACAGGSSLNPSVSTALAVDIPPVGVDAPPPPKPANSRALVASRGSSILNW
jgi:hypothetical protein